ncbi:hypothetical protein BD626DRAFT_572768 [Schizophyllum amplum]|uniref:Protein kinase domain-containing protein n=1 Tax=Schizophyllum amplum TaxID=97359 RepID=A0A550C2Y3_9AGAR|nr:hypothetical protein BD626DRAFT_572768 [Auriculariopsis ampla]
MNKSWSATAGQNLVSTQWRGGNCLRQIFQGETIANGEVSVHSKVLGLEFLRPLVDDMVQAEPSKRPQSTSRDRFETIVGELSTWKLRSRVAKEQDHPLHSLYLATVHWLRRVGFVIAHPPRRTFDMTGSGDAERELWDEEKWWIARRPWLASLGYKLRPRYQPGWKPSWYGTNRLRLTAEDGYAPFSRGVLDATRLSDGTVVMMKRVPKSISPGEVELTVMLNSPPQLSDPRNHCVPLYDVLQVPDDDDIQIMVLPLLRGHANPPFDTVGEAIHCFRQVIQCVQFLHENKIAHRDIHVLNIMMDASPLSTVPFHPTRQNMRRDFKGHWRPSYTRTERPVKY